MRTVENALNRMEKVELNAVTSRMMNVANVIALLWSLKDYGIPPSRSPTLTATAGMPTRGYGLWNLSGARNQKKGDYSG